MLNASFLKDKIFDLFLLVIVSLLLYPLEVKSAVFNVTNEDELRDALSMAESNGEDDIINIGAGLYNTGGATFTYESSEDFSLTIEGEGAGLTILEGGEINRVLEINTESDADVFISISGLTIQNGFHISIPVDMSNPNGAGIFVKSQNLTIQDCEFNDNSVSRAGVGGGLSADVQNKIDLIGNLFSGNSAAFDGGGANLQAFELNISGNQFIDNSVELGAGGGVYMVSSVLNLSDNEFIGNSSASEGGGLYSGEADVIATNNIFGQNSTNGQIGGGAVFSNSGLVNLTNNTVSLNSTDMFGSALVIDNIPISTNNVINIYNNIAIENFISEGSDILVRTQPFPVPTSPPTGFPDPVTIDYGTVNLFNNDYSMFEAEKSFGCDVSQVTCVLEINEGNNIFDLPLFVNPEAADFSLLPDSPCIDAGDPDAPEVPDTDIFGNPRVPPPDMGAVEFIEEVVKGGGGCSIVSTPVTSSLAVFLVIPVLILIRRIMKRPRD